MSATIQVKRRINGASGSPTGTSKAGEVALNFPGAAGATTTPELWASDGTAWRRVNPPAAAPTVGVAALPGGAIGSATGIGGAWTALGTKPTDPIIIATFAGSAYLKTGAGAADGDWTALGSSTSFATNPETKAGTISTKALTPANLASMLKVTGDLTTPANDAGYIPALGAGGKIALEFLTTNFASSAEVLAGTVTDKTIAPDTLQARLVTSPDATPANDARKIVQLNATGKIDAGFLPATASALRGAVDVTAAIALTPAAKAGEYWFANKAGTVHASWTGAGGQTVASGDMVVFDGTNFHLVPNDVDLAAYVPLAGTTGMTGNIAWAGAANNKAGTNIVDGKGGTLDNVVVDAGTF